MHVIMRNEEEIVHLAHGSSPKSHAPSFGWVSICGRPRIRGRARGWAPINDDQGAGSTNAWLKRHSYSLCLDCLAALE